MSNFHDDAVQLMTDILNMLNQEAQSSQVGDSSTGNESVYSVLLRLVGVSNSVVLNINNKATDTTTQPGVATKDPNLVDDFFKIQDRSTELQLAQINLLLKTFKQRLSRYSKARQSIKLNRTKRLIDPAAKPLDASKLVLSTPEQTRKGLTAAQSKLQKEGDITGIIAQDIAIQTALGASINNATPIPENIGNFASQLTNFLRSTATEAEDNIYNLTLFQNEIQSEVNKLENAQKLLFDGSPTFSGPDQTLALINILNLLIFLTDRKQMLYNCSQCKFFRPGKSNVCIFAGAGGSSSPTSLVNLIDQSGNPVVGRLTQPNNSCKQVWGLDSNEYYAPADSITQALTKLLKGK
jgi:hypothetical protein